MKIGAGRGLRHHDQQGDLCLVNRWGAAEALFRDGKAAGSRFYGLLTLYLSS
jgi:hypothetical protein